MTTHIDSSVNTQSSILHTRVEEEVTRTTKSKNLVLAIALVVAAVLLVVGALAGLLLLPHFGVVVSPMLALLAIPILVGLVKMIIAIFILHRPIKDEVSKELSTLDNFADGVKKEILNTSSSSLSEHKDSSKTT